MILTRAYYISVDPLLDLVLQVLEFAVFLKELVVMDHNQKIAHTSQVQHEQLVQVVLLQYAR